MRSTWEYKPSSSYAYNTHSFKRMKGYQKKNLQNRHSHALHLFKMLRFMTASHPYYKVWMLASTNHSRITWESAVPHHCWFFFIQLACEYKTTILLSKLPSCGYGKSTNNLATLFGITTFIICLNLLKFFSNRERFSKGSILLLLNSLQQFNTLYEWECGISLTKLQPLSEIIL